MHRIPAPHKIAMDVDHGRPLDLDVYVLPGHARLAAFLDQSAKVRLRAVELRDDFFLPLGRRAQTRHAGTVHLVDQQQRGARHQIPALLNDGTLGHSATVLLRPRTEILPYLFPTIKIQSMS